MPMNPFEDRGGSRQRLLHVYARQVSRTLAARLKLRADVGGGQLAEFVTGPAKNTAGMGVAEKEAAGAAIEDDDSFGRVIDDGAQAGFTGGEFGGAFGDAPFQ